MKNKLIAVIGVLILALSLSTITVFAANDVAIDQENFPDDIFRNYVLNNIDGIDGAAKDNILSTDEISKVIEFSLDNQGIGNLKGIEYFSALEEIYINNNQITELDVSGCINLKYLYVSRNQLKELNVSGLSNLEYIHAYSNQLTKVDVSGCIELKRLGVSNNQLTKLNVNNNTALTQIYANENRLTELDINGSSNLQEIYAYSNQLTKIDVSGCIDLKRLNVDDNQLTELDVSQNTALEWLYAVDNQLTKLDLSKNTALMDLYVSNNQLTKLDLSKNTALIDLYVSNNQLTKLDLSKNTNLEFVVLNDDIEAQIGGMLYYIKSGDNFVVDLGLQLGFSEEELANIKLTDGQGATYDAATGKVTFTSVPTTLIYTYATGGVTNFQGISSNIDMDVAFTVERDPKDKDTETPDTETPDPETPDTETPDPETPNVIETVTIIGRIVDTKANPMANVVVAMFFEPVYTFTDANGYFKLENVPVGTHILRVFATLADYEAYVADLKAGNTPSVKPLVEIQNVIVTKDENGNIIINIDGKQYSKDDFNIQVNEDGTVDISTINPTTSDSNNIMIFVMLLAVSMAGLVVVKTKKSKVK